MTKRLVAFAVCSHILEHLTNLPLVERVLRNFNYSIFGTAIANKIGRSYCYEMS